MPILASGANVTLALTDYDSVTVSTQGVVVVEALSGLGVTAGRLSEHTGTRTFGAFSQAGSLKLTAQGRDALYEVADGVATAPTGGGAAINTLPSGLVFANTAVDTIAAVIGGVSSQMTIDNLIDGLGVADADLPAAAALNGADILPISQGGVAVRTTLAALATFLGGGLPAAPGPVTSLAAGTATTTTIPLTWVNSATTTSWTVKQRLAGSGSYVDSTLSVAATATGATVSGLTASTAYDFQVFATNAGGTSAAATLLATSTAATGGSAPDPVTSLASPSHTDTRATLTWVNGAGATGWTVEQRPTGSGSYTTCTLSTAAAATGCVVSGLAGATGYDFRVTTTNAYGSGTPVVLVNVVTSAAMTVTGYSGNAVLATTDGTTPTTTQGSLKGFTWNKQATAQYWSISNPPASAKCGWGTSSTVPPAEITAGQNVAGGASVNGMSPMSKPGQFQNDGYLWVPVGSGTTTWYFWVLPLNGTAQCMNPSGMTVTGA